MEQTISIAFCLDDNYVEQVSAVIRSISHTNPQNVFDIHLVFNSLSEANQRRLNLLANNHISINLKPTKIVVDGVGPKNHVSNATFIKFEIIKLLSELGKVLYLDGDLIVLGDLTPLWQTDISARFLAAVENPLSNRNSALSMKADAVYFNAGIMLLNLEKLREADYYSKAHKYIDENPELLLFHDQDVFNYLVNGDYVKLDSKYNFQTFFIRKFDKFSTDRKKKIKESLEHAVILHYSSGVKPWYLFDPHPRVASFRKYFNAPLSIDSSDNIFKQILRYLFVKFYYLRHGIF